MQANPEVDVGLQGPIRFECIRVREFLRVEHGGFSSNQNQRSHFHLGCAACSRSNGGNLITMADEEWVLRIEPERFKDDVREQVIVIGPGGSLGFRVESADSVFVLATDCELDLVAQNAAEVKENDRAVRQYDERLLEFFRGVDLLVIDCQFLDEEYPLRRGWGHNPVATVVDLCHQVSPKMAALFHHDPQHTDDMVTSLVMDSYQRLEKRGARDMLIFAAREGVTMSVRRPRPPAKLATVVAS